jgi:hypothetical protein
LFRGCSQPRFARPLIAFLENKPFPASLDLAFIYINRHFFHAKVCSIILLRYFGNIIGFALSGAKTAFFDTKGDIKREPGIEGMNENVNKTN